MFSENVELCTKLENVWTEREITFCQLIAIQLKTREIVTWIVLTMNNNNLTTLLRTVNPNNRNVFVSDKRILGKNQ